MVEIFWTPLIFVENLIVIRLTVAEVCQCGLKWQTNRQMLASLDTMQPAWLKTQIWDICWIWNTGWISAVNSVSRRGENVKMSQIISLTNSLRERNGEMVRQREIGRECHVTQSITGKDGEDREIEKPTESRCSEIKNGVWWKRWAVQIDWVLWASRMYVERQERKRMGYGKLKNGRKENEAVKRPLIIRNITETLHMSQLISTNEPLGLDSQQVRTRNNTLNYR